MVAKGLSIGFMTRFDGAIAKRMFKGFRSIAIEQGWQLSVLRRWHANDGIAELIQRWSLDAAFVQGELYESLDAKIWGSLPIVTFSPPFAPTNTPGRVSAVAFDDRAVGAAAAAHLLSRGLQQFAYVFTGQAQFAQDRFEGFAQALRGRPVHHCDLAERIKGSGDLQRLQVISAWLRSLPRPCGVFVPCDMWGVLLLEWCLAAGISVPKELAVISVDGDDNLCECTVPPLSSVDLPWEDLGRAAGRQLVAMLKGEAIAPRAARLPPGRIVARRSTDMAAIGDRDVQQALEMIAARALGPLRPADVIAHIGASRNKLREDFHRAVGRTLSEEIQRVRIEEAKRLLAHGDLPVEQIADRCGFATTELLRVAFTRVVGTTPGAFRKRQLTCT